MGWKGGKHDMALSDIWDQQSCQRWHDMLHAYPEVIAVTAGTRQGVIAPYANYGSFVDVIAPGSAIVNFNGQSWLVTGTSASTAYASGAAAALLEKDGKLSAAQIEAQIRAIFGSRRQ